MGYNSYSKNAEMFPPSGGGTPAPDPCPASKSPNPIATDVSVLLASDGQGGGIGSFTIASALYSAGAAAGPEFPPCSAPFQTSGPAKDFTWELRDFGGPVVTPDFVDTQLNGLLNRYELTCADEGPTAYSIYVTGAGGTDFVSITVTAVNPTPGVCP